MGPGGVRQRPDPQPRRRFENDVPWPLGRIERRSVNGLGPNVRGNAAQDVEVVVALWDGRTTNVTPMGPG